MAAAQLGRFRYSIRTLLLATAVCALILTPVVWVARERRQMLAAQEAMLRAREVALQSVVREEKRRRADSAAGEHLRRENASLKQEVESLRREVQQLRNPSASLGQARP
jgi:hypothetical protein